jgi:hypothetical protein
MVSSEERETLKVLLKGSYTTEVLQVLAENGTINKSTNKPYSTGFISNVLGGTYENAEIEAALWNVYQKRLDAKLALQWQKENLKNKVA